MSQAAEDGSPLGAIPQARRYAVRGVVQGAGLRPFVYRLAHERGLAGWVRNTSWGMEIEESAVPAHEPVRAASEPPALAPLYVAKEGKLIAMVAEGDAGPVLDAMGAHRHGREAAIIGRALADHPRRVVLRTWLGTRRLLDMLAGEQRPRIC